LTCQLKNRGHILRVLIVDEDAASVADGKARLVEAGYDCNRIDFNDLDTELITYLPDFIVLDLMNGNTANDPKGEGGKISFKKIWGIRFRPIVIYSADPDLIDDMESGNANHPLVKKVKKGSGSDEKLKEVINQFKPCVEGMNGITEDVNNVLNTTLRDVAQHIYAQEDISDKEIAIKHMGRRRLSALMDDATFLRFKLSPWEQLICPPLADYPRMGDIIRDTKADPESPQSFRIILTPSCDLVKAADRKEKVSEVLCARCETAELLLSKVHGSKKKEIRKNLSGLLTQGYIDECLPIPGFQGVIPPMVANLKELELIPYESIKNEDDGISFVRVASVDSPFREQIAWAYMSTSSRPGVPDRDCDLWATQYLGDSGDKGEKE